MKKKSSVLSLLVGILLLTNCGGNTSKNLAQESVLRDKQEQDLDSVSCIYNQVEINAYEVGTDKLLESKNIKGCFSITEVDKNMGLVEISNHNGNIKVLYYKEQNPSNIEYLDVKLGEGVSRWRKRDGHDIFIADKGNDLTFIFGDRHKSKIKGTVKFTK